MTDAEMLVKVKAGLTVVGTYNDTQLQIKVSAVKNYMLNAGVTQEIIESDLGITTITVGVLDLWNLSSGEVKFSEAFSQYLLPQLMAVSLDV
ncbi:hypothetical protein SDC9_73756 [bioreactor metagenome]|uniref:Uncharacterized protein n=1 Tax=bioreactor metagenome TaxID=1076179 RepID=A0A644YFG8_9ZZZZ